MFAIIKKLNTPEIASFTRLWPNKSIFLGFIKIGLSEVLKITLNIHDKHDQKCLVISLSIIR